MKNLKKILSIVIIISMLASFFVTSHASEEVTYTLDIINYTDANDDALLTLDGATAIKVNSAVTASASTDVMFVAALYNGETLVKTSGKTTVTATAGVKADLSATITLDAALPTPATGYKVKTFVWEESEKTPVIPANVFPNSDVALESVTVDGTEVQVADTMTYEVPVDQMVAPKVVAKAKNASTKVSVTNPVDFPGSATITLTANDGTEKEYVINYTTTCGVTQTYPDIAATADNNRVGTNFHAADDADALLVSDSAATPTSFKFGSHVLGDRAQYLKEGSTAGDDTGKFVYFNDIRSINDAYDYLHGTDFIKSEVSNRGVKFKLSRPAIVRVFGADGTALTNADASTWKVEARVMSYMKVSISRGQGMPEGYNSLSPACDESSFNTMYYKAVNANEEIAISTNGFNRIIVIDYLGYIQEPELALSSVTVDGVALSPADIRNTEIEVAVSADALWAPVVTAQAYDSNATVEVINPGEKGNPNVFPGKTIVRVTNGEEYKDYTLKHKASTALINVTSGVLGTDFHGADDINATTVSGYVVGSQLYADRTCPAYVGNNAANGIAYYNDIRSIADKWDYLNGTDFIKSKVGGKVTATFTLNRNAVVRVFSQGSAAPTASFAWTTELDNAGHLIASTTTGENANKFTYMFYKDFNAGDQVTFTTGCQETIIVIDYAGYRTEPETALESLSIGGNAITGLDLDKAVHTCSVSGDVTVLPSVDATAFDADATLEIIYPGQKDNPNVFPGKTLIRVTNGNKTREYTVKYTTSDELLTTTDVKYGKNFHAADDDNATIVSGAPYGSSFFQDRDTPSGTAYCNDIRAIADEWDYLNGTDYFMTSVNGSRAISFTLNRDAIVRVFSNSTAAMSGWTMETNANGYMFASVTSGQFTAETSSKLHAMFYKSFKKGDTVSYTLGSRDAVTVIEYVGCPNELALAALEVGGEAKTIESNTYWTHPVASDAATCPAVVATAADSTAEVDVIYPFEDGNVNVFPGKTIVRVTKGNKTAEYTVQYTCEGLTAIKDMSSTGGRADYTYFGSNFHEPGDFGNTYGSQLYYDRIGTPQGSATVINYYNDIRVICDELDYLKGTDYIMANRNQNSVVAHNFTLNRAATVRAFHLSGNNNGIASLAGWTTETNANGYIKTSHTLGAGVEGHEEYCALDSLTHMTYKAFEAGEKVTVNAPGSTAIVVLDYEGYTGADE